MANVARELADLRDELGERYEVTRELGRGGMGAVYLARDLRLDRQVAIKVLPRALATDSTLRERFVRETRTAASFSHPNIVPVHAIEERPELLAFVMGYVEGESLSARVSRAGPLEAREILRLLLDIGYALAYAHGRDVVHRDVKPDNVMLERATGRALLMDFGISRSVTASAAAAGMTRVGEVVGTPEYMSPEQAVGDVLDGRSDLYSLALTAYFAATGRPVFSGESTQKILMRQLSESPPALSSLRPDLPRALTDAVDRCLAKDPAERFESAGELVSALEGAQSFAPDVPMPIRLFAQELATLGMVTFFAMIFLWLVVTVIRSVNDSDDVFIPVVLLFSILLGRFAQTMGDARRMMRQGFSRSDVIGGLRAVLAERETRRIQLRSDPHTRRMRRFTVAVAVGMLIMAAALVRYAMEFRHPRPTGGYFVETPGSIMFLSALVQAGIGFALLVRSPLRKPLAERVYGAVWLGPIGRGLLFLVAPRGTAATSRRVTGIVSTGSTGQAVGTGNRVDDRKSFEDSTATGGNGAPPDRHDALPERIQALEARVSHLERITGER